ncbi:hypothetical protein V8C43DRAFT_328683 [Trichoderma afarasin]
METYNDTESFWPEMYEGLPPPSSSPPVPAMAAMERQSTPWETLQAFEDERLSTNSSVMRVSLYGPFYAHLPNVYLDWELEGYRYNEMQAPRQQTPPPLTNYVRQNTEAAPKEATTPSRQYIPTEIEDSQAEDLWTASSTSIRQNTEATPNEATAPVGPLDSQDIPTFIEIPNSQTEDLWSETSTPVHQNIEPTPHEATTPVDILDGRYTPTIIEIPDSQAEDLWSEIFTPSKIEDGRVLLDEATAPEVLPSEIEDSQGGIQHLLTAPLVANELESDDGTDSESVKSVIYITPCELPDYERCTLGFTTS